MRQPLVTAVIGALIGFGGWIWLTGPGTSVPNALLALLCAILCGRLAWWLAVRGSDEEEAPEAGSEGATTAAQAAGPSPTGSPAVPRTGRRAPPPVDQEPWRKPEHEA